MAQAIPQAYAQQNKGTLIPGQTISVNKYTVQVERYLSQGGFAHVYLVRTATPVYNTTHHVLKRIAVPNEAMLTEVKKEVDIMRILKGHPNIVYLIDAAWHRVSNGTYEVFILMEFCSGGGIIDMMNRRLRERLTEPEILTIFVDVCEGLAAMHNLKPALLHRDLKVENILQASATSYKLCDFGSTTPVQRVPTNSQEIRALEADLNRHTTLQYRAPEMVDVYLRRPVDEKSDVWALGVLLYKLCYYTTPFEEHGPLAILNVQYKIPPYPAYSTQMNALIASMLREYGAQRPSVFEILEHVHRLRGTKSRFTYTIPPKEPLSPRGAQPPLQALSPNIVSPPQVQTNPLDDLVSFKSQQRPPAKNNGVEAREKVLEAIAPMRRGRPAVTTLAAPTPPTSPKKEKAFEFDVKFGAEDDRAWRNVRGQKSDTGAVANTGAGTDAWGLDSRGHQKTADRKAFDNDFSSSFGKGFGDTFEPTKPSAVPTGASPQPGLSPKPPPQPARLQAVRATSTASRDAFDGLGLSAPSAPPTLGEARRTRTGLASLGVPHSSIPPNVAQQFPSGLGSSTTVYRPPSTHGPLASPSPHPQLHPQSQTLSPAPTQWHPHSKAPSDNLSAEERFPSLEDLDRDFVSPSPRKTPVPMVHAPTQPAARPSSRSNFTAAGRGADSVETGSGRNRFDGVRSQHVTGIAMRDSKLGSSRPSVLARPSEPPKDAERDSRGGALPRRPSGARRHRSSITMKSTPRVDSLDLLSGSGHSPDTPPALPPRPTPSPRKEPRDWLTGADDELPVHRTPSPQPQPVLRDSPSKRASFFERSPIDLQRPLEAESVLESYYSPAEREEAKWNRDKTHAREKEQKRERRSSKSPGRNKAYATRTGTGIGSASIGRTQGLKVTPIDTAASRQPSPSGLTDNWSPISRPIEPKSSSSSSDGGPEDLNGYVPRGGTPEKTDALRRAKAGDGRPSERRRRTRSKSRQSSVHDLVGIWDGGSTADKDKVLDKPRETESGLQRRNTALRQTDKRTSVIMPSQSLKPTSITVQPRAESPQPLIDTSAVPPRPLPSRPPSSPHKRQPSANPTRQGPIPAPVPAPSAGRSRPQSMFLTSLSKSSSAESNASSSTANTAPQGLALPPDARAHRTTRRSSISDMVQHYEAIGSKVKSPAAAAQSPPAVAPKPTTAGFDIKLRPTTHDGSGMPSPSAAASRFPRLSPQASPVLSKAGLGLTAPHDAGAAARMNGRTSPSGLPSRGMDLDGRHAAADGLPARRSPFQLEPRREAGNGAPPEPPASPFPTAGKMATPPEADVRAPSPERPYQGVSRLIDRWNRGVDDTVPGARKAAGANVGGAAPARRVGVVGEAGQSR